MGITKKLHLLPLKDWGSWAPGPLGIYIFLVDGCSQHPSQHFKTSQAVLGDIIHPACSCYVHLMLSVSARAADARERKHPFHGQLKDIWGWVPFHVEEFLCSQITRNIVFNWCMCMLRDLVHWRIRILSCSLEWMHCKLFLEKRRGSKTRQNIRKFTPNLQLIFVRIMLLWIVELVF